MPPRSVASRGHRPASHPGSSTGPAGRRARRTRRLARGTAGHYPPPGEPNLTRPRLPRAGRRPRLRRANPRQLPRGTPTIPFPESRPRVPASREARQPPSSRPLSCRPAQRGDNSDSREAKRELRRVDSGNSGNFGTAPMPGFGRARASRRRSWQKGRKRLSSRAKAQTGRARLARRSTWRTRPPRSVGSARYAAGTAARDLVRRTDRNDPGGPVLYRRDSHPSAGARGAQGASPSAAGYPDAP